MKNSNGSFGSKRCPNHINPDSARRMVRVALLDKLVRLEEHLAVAAFAGYAIDPLDGSNLMKIRRAQVCATGIISISLW